MFIFGTLIVYSVKMATKASTFQYDLRVKCQRLRPALNITKSDQYLLCALWIAEVSRYLQISMEDWADMTLHWVVSPVCQCWFVTIPCTRTVTHSPFRLVYIGMCVLAESVKKLKHIFHSISIVQLHQTFAKRIPSHSIT